MPKEALKVVAGTSNIPVRLRKRFALNAPTWKDNLQRFKNGLECCD